MKSKSLLAIAMLALAATACSPKIASFNADTDINRYFLRDLMPADVDHLEVYKTTFYEELVEDDNLIELTTRSENSTREKITYRAEKREFRELYMFLWLTADLTLENQWRENYVYFSAKFRYELVTENGKSEVQKVCLGFGPSYYGTAEIVNNHKVIVFEQNLKSKPAREGDKKHYLRKKSISDKLQFVILPGDFSESGFTVSKVINSDNNKIGGKKNLVYDVGNVIGDEEALKFNYVTSFTKPL